MNFQGANVIITGGSSGIGKATAKLLAREGANVFLIARNQKKLDQTVQELEAERVDAGQLFQGFSADVRHYKEVEAAVTAIVQAGGPPDILINSAGITHPGYFEEIPLSIFRDIMDTNYFGTLHTIKAVLPHLLAKRDGHIVNISSMAGFLGVFGYTAYSASKFAVRGFSDVLRCELKQHNIRVSVVCPPDTDTPQLWAENKIKPLETKMITGAAKPEKLDRVGEFIAYGITKLFIGEAEPMSPEQVARTLLRGIQRGDYLIIPGMGNRLIYYISGLLSPLVNWVFDQMAGLARKQRSAL